MKIKKIKRIAKILKNPLLKNLKSQWNKNQGQILVESTPMSPFNRKKRKKRKKMIKLWIKKLKIFKLMKSDRQV